MKKPAPVVFTFKLKCNADVDKTLRDIFLKVEIYEWRVCVFSGVIEVAVTHLSQKEIEGNKIEIKIISTNAIF